MFCKVREKMLCNNNCWFDENGDEEVVLKFVFVLCMQKFASDTKKAKGRVWKFGRIRLDEVIMANIAIQRIKREFKEVVKSEEVSVYVYLCL